MRKQLHKFFRWVLSYGEEVVSPNRVERSPFDQVIRGNQSRTFTVIQAENGTVVQTYNYNTDGARFWVVPEGKSIGNMVDVVLVAEKLK